MRIKICGIKTEEDVKAVSDSGADAAGFLVGQLHASQDFILPSTAARLVNLLPPFITPAIVTHLTEPEEIADIVLQTGVTTIQLHGDSTVEHVIELRDRIPPGSKLILAAHLSAERDFVNLMEYYRLVNAFILDTLDPVTGRVGGTGKTHDWQLSAKFVKTSPLPVLLAGGLDNSNVGTAIKTVQPYGVDLNSSMKNSDGNVDPVKCRDFVNAVRVIDSLLTPS